MTTGNHIVHIPDCALPPRSKLTAALGCTETLAGPKAVGGTACSTVAKSAITTVHPS